MTQRERALALAEEMTRAYLSADSEHAGMIRIADLIEAALADAGEQAVNNYIALKGSGGVVDYGTGEYHET